MPSDKVTVGNGNSPLESWRVDVVGLGQHIAGRRHDAFGLRIQGVRRGAKYIVEDKAEAMRQFRGRRLEGFHLGGTDRQDFRRQPGSFFAECGGQRLGQLQTLLIGRNAHILVRL